MKPINLIIFILALTGSECRLGIIEEKSDDDKLVKLAEAAMTMLSCYEKEVNTVGAAGISERILYKMLSEQSIPVALVGDDITRAAENNRTVDKWSRHKLQLFVIEATSLEQLDGILRRVKSSQWWNHMAKYMILDWPSEKSQQGCSKAFEYLWTAWTKNLLSAMYVCLDKSKEKVIVYNFNPYTSQAPVPWRLENTYKGKHDHPWTTFVREYNPADKAICSNLNFVKTHNLGGYRLDGSIQTYVPRSYLNKYGLEELWKRHKFLNFIIEALNASSYLTIFTNEETQGSMEPIIQGILNGVNDIMWNEQYNQLVLNFTQTYVITRSGLKVMTQYRGQMSQLEKILGVLDRSTRYGLCFVMFISLLFFKFFMRQSLVTAILNVVRIVANSSLTKDPKETAPRLYLAGVFILVVTIVGIYQGLIASLLTKPTPLKDVETIEDLLASHHTIHGNDAYNSLFANPVWKGRYVAHEDTDTIPYYKYVEQDPLAACLGDQLYLIDDAIGLKLHLTRDVIFPMDYVFIIREDWPLEDRVNEILAAFTENYMNYYVYYRFNDYLLKKTESNAKWEANRPSKVMTLSDLEFAFAILGIGLSLATVAFIVEVAMKPASLRTFNAR